MKTLLFVTTVIVCSFSGAQAQNKTVTDSIDSLIQSARKALGEKNFRKSAALYNESISFSDAQSEQDVPQWYKQNVRSFAYYDLACIYSLIGQKTASLNAFRNAIDAGYKNYEWAVKDSDLRNVRDESAFKDMIRELKQKYDYPAVLKSSGAYRSEAGSDQRPVFTYLPADDPRLIRLRQTLDLDSIAGDGDEISRIKNLCLWAHNAVRHDGSSSNPAEKNALALLKVCREENRGINCRMMATILNECYLAAGFKSRLVTCMPKDENDPDCHVVNIVWSDTLDGWIMADPTFYAFLTDKTGRLLGIEEARRSLINGKTIRLNPEANWNGQKKSQDEYLNYMSKNFYWFCCPEKSTVDTESEGKRENEHYVNLVSGDFLPWYNNTDEYTSRDPGYFWARPK